MSSGVLSAVLYSVVAGGHTLIEVAFVEIVGAGNVHVVETCYLQAVIQYGAGRVAGYTA